MEWEKYIFQMEILMKVCGKMDLNMVEANIAGVMEIIIKVGFGLINEKAKELFTIAAVVVIKDIGKMIKNKVREYYLRTKELLKF